MATNNTNETGEAGNVNGLIGLGYEREDYCCPAPADGKNRPTKTIYPTFRVCGEAAAELHRELLKGKLLDGEFAAIVVLKNTMLRIADEDEDEDAEEDVEMEFTLKAIMPHAEEEITDEAKILADFEKLPKPVLDSEDDNDEPAEAPKA